MFKHKTRSPQTYLPTYLCRTLVRCAPLITIILLVGRVNTCPSGYENNGLTTSSPAVPICIHTSSSRLDYCAAQAYCRKIGGELLMGKEAVAKLPGDIFFVGLTDLLEERKTNKSGWRWSNGEFADPSVFKGVYYSLCN